MRTAFVFSCFLVLAGEAVFGQTCDSLYYGSSSHIGTIGFNATTSWAAHGLQSPNVGGAADLWNTNCGVSSTYRPFPQLFAGSGDMTISVDYLPISDSRENPDSCGEFRHQLDNSNTKVIGGSIVFFGKTLNGADCSTHVKNQVTLMYMTGHEMGHVLGLGDTSCSDRIMGSGLYSGIGPHPKECSTAGDFWTTTNEQQSCDISCSTGSCSGTPLTCPALPPPDEPDPTVTCPDCPSNCMESPIIVDVGSGEYRLTGLSEGTVFDIDGDGDLDRVSWIADSTSLLVLDRNANGLIDDALELFGTATILMSGVRAENGFVALAEFDVSQDGKLDENDPIWNRLQLWTDRNGNGVSESDELLRVRESPLRSISLTVNTVGRRDSHGNLLRYSAMADIGRATRPVYDVFFVIQRQ